MWTKKIPAEQLDLSAITDSINNIGSSHPVYSGKWRTVPYIGAAGAATGYNGTIWYVPYVVDASHTVTDIGIEIVVGIAASTIRLALYSDNAGVPNALIEQSSTIASTASLTQATYPFASPIALAASNKVYWLAIQASVSTISLRLGTSVVNFNYNLGTGATAAMYFQNQAYGAFPSTATASPSAIAQTPLICLKAQ